MSLFDYPAQFPPRIGGEVSRAARAWCVGGLFWLGVALLAFFLAGVKGSIYPGILISWPGSSTGTFLILGKTAFLYGWGLPFIFGTGLLIFGENTSCPLSLARAGAWVWHLAVAGGLGAILGMASSGVEGMAFPSYLWPVLVLACLPACSFILNRYLSGAAKDSMGTKMAVMSVSLCLLLLIGAGVVAFMGDLEPYYYGLSAKSVESGLLLSGLGGFGIACAFCGEEQGGKEKYWILPAYLLMLASGLMQEMIRDGMPWEFNSVAQGCALAGQILFLVLFAVALWRKEHIGSSVLVCTALFVFWTCFSAGAWEGRLFAEVVGLIILAVGSGIRLAERLPRCMGGDWVSGVWLGKCLWMFLTVPMVWFVLFFLRQTYASGLDYFLIMAALAFLVGMSWLFLSVQILLLWFGLGRMTYIPEKIFEKKTGGRES